MSVSGHVAEYKQKKRRETQMMNLATVASSGTSDDPSYGLDDERESDKNSFIVHWSGTTQQRQYIGNP